MGNNAIFQVVVSIHSILYPTNKEIKIFELFDEKDFSSNIDNNDYKEYIKQYKKYIYPPDIDYEKYKNTMGLPGEVMKVISLKYLKEDFKIDIEEIKKQWDDNGFNKIRHKAFAHKDISNDFKIIHDNYQITQILSDEGILNLKKIVYKISIIVNLISGGIGNFEYEQEIENIIAYMNKLDDLLEEEGNKKFGF